MLGEKKESGRFVLLLKPTDDKRLRYIIAKKLLEIWPETPFAQWKTKVDAGETFVLKRAENPIDLDRLKRDFEAISAPVEIVEQKSIGGASVF